MNSFYDAIYLSPHLDDVALSCGGQIHQRTAAGQSVLIVNVAAGEPLDSSASPFAEWMHAQWQLPDDAVTTRRAEDEAACRVLGAHCIYWSLPDCIYRHDPASGEPLYTSQEALFGPLAEAEMALVEQVAEQMAALPAHGAVLSPLTAGNHVDHQLTRLAAEHAFGSALAYYEDYPYAAVPQAVDRVLARRPCWRLQVIDLTETAVAARINAIAAHASQLGVLFGGETAMADGVRAYIAAVGGERIWFPDEP